METQAGGWLSDLFSFHSSVLLKARGGQPFGSMQASIPGSGSHMPQASGPQGRSCRLVLAKNSGGPGVSLQLSPGDEMGRHSVQTQ